MRRRLAFYLWRLTPVAVLRALDTLHLTYVRLQTRARMRLMTPAQREQYTNDLIARAILRAAAWEAKYGEMED